MHIHAATTNNQNLNIFFVAEPIQSDGGGCCEAGAATGCDGTQDPAGGGAVSGRVMRGRGGRALLLSLS